MKIWLLGLLALALAPAGERYSDTPYLGQTRPKIIALLGSPSAVMSPVTHRVYAPSAHSKVLASSGNVIDSYYKTYGGIEFGVDVLYELDNSESRLHPVERVSAVDITPDKKLPLQTVLAALPATRQLCRDGCKILLTIVYGVNYEAYVYPKTSSEEDPVADAVSKGSDASSVAALDIMLEGTPSSEYQLGALNFNQSKVDLVRICRIDLISIKKMPASRVKTNSYY